MDTTWFAVDADGHVGVFDSGPEAAVPLFTAGSEEGWELIEDLIAHARDLIWAHGDVAGSHYSVLKRGGLWDVLMFLDGDRATPEAMAGVGLDVPLTTFTDETGRRVSALHFDELDPAVFNRLHKQGLCLGCLDRFGDEDRPPHFGVYRFEAKACGNPPYERIVTPRRPLHLTQLTASLRPMAEARRLTSVKFAEALGVQPAELTPCRFWDQFPLTYLASNGVTRVPVEPPSRAADANE